MRNPYIFLILVTIVLLISGAGCITEEQNKTQPTQTTQPTQPTIITANLTNITGGDYVESAGLYEGTLVFEDIETSETYSYFVCTENWSWVKLYSCYKLNLEEIQQNIDNHMHSAELSGCYVGTIEETSC